MTTPTRPAGTFAAITVLGGLLMTVGTLLPWVAVTVPIVGTVSRSGLDSGGDGVVTLLVGVASMALGVLRLVRPLPAPIQRVPLLLGTIGLVIAAVELSDGHDGAAELSSIPFAADLVRAHLGAGLYLVLIGAVLTLAGGLAVGPTAPPG